MSERTAYKDYFDATAATRLANQIARVYPELNKRRFKQQCTRGLDKLEFHDRVKQFSTALHENLPASIDDALDLLTKSLPAPLPDCERVTDGWLQWPVGQFIADFGTQHFEHAFHAMIELTQRFTSEFAVRPFVEQAPEQTFERLLELTSHDNPHVRRWCSEGVRPRLPWGRKLKQLVQNPDPIFPILEQLKDDPELYVRRSVANNLNDVAKDHPQRVIECCRGWSGGSDERQWVVRHALRTLVKDGDPGALELVGFSAPRKIELTLEVTPKRIAVGNDVTLSAELFNGSKRTQNLLLDFVVHYVRKSGQRTEKVFKWKSLELPAGESRSLQKKLPMRETTVRALYPGKHLVELQINGTRMASASFHLKQS
ncbi:MAG: DNA alkylation repair protein [Planctomycetota bacterium]